MTYTTSLAKGQALREETLALIQYWEPGMDAETLAQAAVERNLLAKFTALRSLDIVKRIFAKRYLIDDAQPARVLKTLTELQASPRWITQVLLLYTTRFHHILHDYITQVYWPKYEAGAATLSRDDAEDFIESAYHEGHIETRWSATMRVRVARYLNNALVEFGYADDASGRDKALRTFIITPQMVVFLAYELHQRGVSDTHMLTHRDWQLFGLEPNDVYRQLDLAAAHGHLLIQYAGDLLRAEWTYSSLDHVLHALTR
ncbi:MAG: BrxA family protein [Bacteroidota bacterium]